MSDMSGPRPSTPADAHEQHDALLVSQLVAGDPLDDDRAAQARAWLSGCRECARLATDLRRLSTMVAGEPVPPRRRDFRLDDTTAERLRGNALTRLLRRSSWPRSAAWRPAAAGVLSLGLVFMVAGYAWPDEGAVTMPSGLDTAPQLAEPAPTGALTNEADAPVVPGSPDAELEYPEGLAEHQAGSSAREPAEQLFAAEPEPGTPAVVVADELDSAADDPAGDAGAKAMVAAPEATAVDRTAEAAAAPHGGAAAAQDNTAQEAVTEEGTAEEAVAAQEAVAEEATAAEVATAEEAAGSLALDDALVGAAGPGADPTVADAGSDGAAGFEAWLIVVGVALTLSGGAALLLGWLARRAREPLRGA